MSLSKSLKRFSAQKFSRSQHKRFLQFEPLEERLVLATVPVGFTDTQIYSGSPMTTVQFDQTGRGWIGFDDGKIGIIENDVVVNTNAYDLVAETSVDLGLLGMELDKDFATNGYIYVAYAANDAEPNAKFSRIQVDVTTGNTIIPNSEVVLLEFGNFVDLGNPTTHIVGAVHHAPDGTLYLQVGDHRQVADAPNINSPYGKVLRLLPDGTPALDNPYYDASDGIGWADYVWASGLRNPFAGDLDPVTGRYFISDVGSSLWEEINDATLPGLDFGWPSEEGATGNLGFTDPYYTYSHDNGCAITGGTFYSGVTQQFPAEYEGLYFFSEFCNGEIQAIDPDNPNNVIVFASGITAPLNISFSPDGSMYYIDYAFGAIHKVQYTLETPPQILLQPSDDLVTVGADAQFEVSVTGSSPFSYQWQVDSGGGYSDIPGATDAVLSLQGLTLVEDGNQYRVVVTNAFGTDTSAAATLTVTADTPPVLSMTLTSSSGSTYRGGDTITFSGQADDAEDGILQPESLTWKIDFHHNVHTHPVIESLTGTSSGQFVVPTMDETDPDVWFRVYLTAVDSIGLESTTFLEIFPELSEFSVEATVDDLDLLLDSNTVPNPTTKTGVEGVVRSIDLPESTPVDEGTAYFYQWIDGSEQAQRQISTPTDDTAYIALYGVSEFAIETVYVSDLTPVGTPINGWGPIELDMSNGGNQAGDGGELLLNGVGYEKGLGVHADSEVVYNLNGEYSRFLSDIGLNAGPRETGSVFFEVYGDGNLLYRSALMTGNSATEIVDVDVTGLSELRLVVDGNGAIEFDTANWADARLVRNLPPFDYLSDLTPVGTPVNGWGPIELDMSNGGNQAGDGGVLQLNGVAYTKGLGVHADSEVIYNLNGEYRKFVSDIGLDAGPRESGSVIFEVYGDGALLYSSGLLTGNSATQSLDIDVAGVNELRLVVDGNGAIEFDTANWADAHVVRADAGDVSDIRGVGIGVEGRLLRLLPYTGADATLDAKLDVDDIMAVVDGWGTHPLGTTLDDGLRMGDFNFDGATDEYDWDILNLAWIETYGLSLNLEDFFDVQTTYLSDLTPSVTPINGLGPIELDSTNGDAAPNDGGTILLNGVAYSKGLGVHAESEVIFDLSSGDYGTFLADVGLDNGPRPTGEVIFEVYGDGVLLYSSGVVTGNSATESIGLIVAGIDQLRLVVDAVGATDDDSAVWADARLLTLSPEEILLADFDSDNTVTGLDFLAWQRNFGTASPAAEHSDGDADFDGDVDAQDLSKWQETYGSGVITSNLSEPAASEDSTSQLTAFEEAVVAAPSLLGEVPQVSPPEKTPVEFGPIGESEPSNDLSEKAVRDPVIQVVAQDPLLNLTFLQGIGFLQTDLVRTYPFSRIAPGWSIDSCESGCSEKWASDSEVSASLLDNRESSLALDDAFATMEFERPYQAREHLESTYDYSELESELLESN